ncbi:hypothetical protein [Tsukamurella paurometabola]|uniref:Glycine-rich domain-containing protein n=1 Tax=Tsukamurella paurometabola TaxID=2061 RepID=A0A3P8MBQ7_TSUPA|nr:hypothetical protein [Tsukamurella paurometabola]UEA85713.1 hypothetical protein LK411_06140 [Tsukamurella paurometabola]VDR36963.1 Uncharacterised protein [Tsukamurella paurometabola]
MTSPNLPIGSSDIPQGAFTHTGIAGVLQDYSAGKYRSTVGGRFPSIVGGTPAGSPLSAITPVGIITGILSEFMRVVSNSTSHDISHPADLDDLIHDFFQGLPLVGQFVDLLDAIFGTYDGDDPVLLQIKALFAFLRPDGKIDAGKLFGELPQHILGVITALVSKFTGGLIELGQLKRPEPGQERNWLESFDKPESVPAGDGFEHDATVGRTRLGSAKLTFDGAEHVRTSDPIEVAAGQPLDIGGYVRFDGYTGTGGPAVALRVLAYNSGDQLIGSQQIGTVTPSGATSADFETVMQASWTAPANTAYVYVRMEGLAAGTAGTAHFDDLWLRMPAQSLPQQWVEGLTSALSNLGDGISDAWNFVQNVIDKFMNGRGILGSLFSLSHFETEVAKVFGPGSNIPKNLIDGLDDALDLLLPKTDWSKFLTGFTAAGNNGTAPSTGIPALDGLINAFLGVRTKATDANDTASTVQGTVQVQAVTVGVVDGLTVVRTPITSTQTWTRAAIPAGCTERVKTGVGLVASGQGGGRGTPRSGNDPYSGMGGAGGAGGGYVYAEFTPDEVGTSQLVTIGAGGAGATSMSTSGAFGGMTSFGSLLSIASGAGGGIPTSVGVVYGAGSAGDGGDGGNLVSNGQQPGKQGGRAYLVQGGAAGGTNGGNGGAGQNAPTGDDVLSGGSGGGGGGSDGANFGDSGGRGGDGGIPGGGGGGGGGGGYGGNPGNGGNGGRGEALIEEFFR